MASSITAYRSAILHFLDDPSQVTAEDSYQYFRDGLLLVENGYIKGLGDAAEVLLSLSDDVEIVHYRDGLITPGFVDCHTHYPQMGIIGTYGEQLLEWLSEYTYPVEACFSDPVFAARQAEFFFEQLLSNGTTTALVFGTVHPESVEAFFSCALNRRLRMICGKIMMDRNAPKALLDNADSSYHQSKALIEKWHGCQRLHYAVTPRFAPTSTPEQLQRAGQLVREYSDVYLHTHLSENRRETAWVRELFPQSRHYLDVYLQHGLLGKRSIFAHGVHLCNDEYRMLANSGSGLSFCPSANLFLGSGLFNLKKCEDYNIKVGLGSDVGAGTSFSQLKNMGEAYKVQQLRGDTLTPLKSYFLATLGGARALALDDKIGNFIVGREADFVVLDLKATPLMAMRQARCKNLVEQLSVLCMLGDDRCVKATYIMGKQSYQRD